ncbi:Ig-like domain-containing protein [Deinococcota bacterium DY0809b]
MCGRNRKPHRGVLLVTLALGFVLAACSGTEASPPDTAGPVLVRTVPAAGAVDVSLNDPIQLVFNEPVAPASVTSSTVRVVADGQALDYSFRAGGAGETILLQLTSFPATTPAQVTLTVEGVADAAGNRSGRSTLVFTSADTTAPLLLEHTPADGSDGVLLADPLRLGFSEPMDPASLSTDGVRILSGGVALPYVARWSPDAKALQLVLAQAPASLPATLRVELSGLADVAGNPMAAASFTYTTAAEWVAMGGALNRNGTTGADAPTVRYDGQRLLTVFRQFDNTVWVVYWDGETSAWEPLGGAAVTSGDGSAFRRSPRMEVAPDGSLLVSYIESSNGLVVKRWNGASWERLGSPVTTSGGNIGFSPVLAVGPAGEVVVGWVGQVGSTWYQFVARWNESAPGWELLGGGPEGAAFESTVAAPLALGQGGKVFALALTGGIQLRSWDEAASAWVDEGAAHSRAGGSIWGTLLRYDGQGRLVASWREDGDAFAADWGGAANGWTDLGGALDRKTADTCQALELAYDAAGRLWALVHADDGNGNREMYVVRWNEADGRWVQTGSAAVAAISGISTFLRASMTLDGNDLPVVAWHDDASTQHVLVERYNGLAR